MREITLRINETYYNAFLHFIKTLTYVEVKEQNNDSFSIVEEPAPKYDFSDIAGQLEWQGDAVATQRALRNEW
jgi:hypothetical protein